MNFNFIGFLYNSLRTTEGDHGIEKLSNTASSARLRLNSFLSWDDFFPSSCPQKNYSLFYPTIGYTA